MKPIAGRRLRLLTNGAPQPGKSAAVIRPATCAAGGSCRILIVSQATVDGVAVCVRDLVQAAVDGGYDVTVACPSTGDLAGWARERGAAWERLEMRRSPHPGDIAAVRRIRRLAQASDLVHLHSSKAGAAGRLALASLGRSRPPSVFTPHGWSWLVGGWLAPASPGARVPIACSASSCSRFLAC